MRKTQVTLLGILCMRGHSHDWHPAKKTQNTPTNDKPKPTPTLRELSFNAATPQLRVGGDHTDLGVQGGPRKPHLARALEHLG